MLPKGFAYAAVTSICFSMKIFTGWLFTLSTAGNNLQSLGMTQLEIKANDEAAAEADEKSKVISVFF